METISRKGKAARKDSPLYYDEVKTQIKFHLTPTAIRAIDNKARELGVSRSEFIEQYARSLI